MSQTRSTIICVDDDRWIIEVLSGLLHEWLRENYKIEKALSGPEAIEIIDDCVAEGEEISLVISDYIMPGMKGDELLEQVKLKTPLTRRIMLTGFAAIEGITNAINKAGIYRFLSKPWDNKDMMLTVVQAIRSYEQDKRAEKLAQSHQDLYQKMQVLVSKTNSNYKSAINSLAAAAEARDSSANGHSARVAKYAGLIAQKLELHEDIIKGLDTAALLHDVGKLGLSDADIDALRGNGCYTKKDMALTQAEQAKIIIKEMDWKILHGVIYHTERMDGLGPYGLKSSSIPIEARIIGLCNYFDIACAARPGDEPSDVLRSISPDKGKIFDEKLYEILAELI